MILLCTLLLTILAGASCASKAPDEIRLGLCLPLEGEGFAGSLIVSAREAAQKSGAMEVVEAPSSASSQLLLESIDELIEKNVDAVVLYCEDQAALSSAAERLMERKIPLILIGNGLGEGGQTALIRGDDYAIGKAAAQAIAGRLEGQGNVLQLTGLPCSMTDERRRGFEEELARHSGLTLIASDGTGGRADTARALMEVWLDTSEIGGVYCHSDEIAIGAIEAIQALMREDVQIVTGVGGRLQAVEMLVKNHRYLKETYLYSPAVAAEAVSLAMRAAAGEEIPAETVLPLTVINAFNALEYQK